VLLGVDLAGTFGELLGGLAVVVAGLGYAIGGFVIKHRFSDAQPIGVAAAVMVPSTIMLAPVAAFTAPGEVPGLGPIAAVATLGVLGTGVAFAIFYTLMARVGPARAFIVTYLAPGFAVGYGAILLDETITVTTVLGLLLILAGSWLAAEGRLPGRKAPAAPPDEPCPPPEVAPAGELARAQASVAIRRSSGAAR
jgi:drug/metabolite transporter (DMT)-like permease